MQMERRHAILLGLIAAAIVLLVIRLAKASYDLGYIEGSIHNPDNAPAIPGRITHKVVTDIPAKEEADV